MHDTRTVALRELLERVKENPNGVGDADLGLHGFALAELEVLEQASRPSPATAAEPAPQRTDSPEVWPLVIRDVESGASGAPEWLVKRLAADMRARDAAGRAKYGVPLQVENGRRAGVDAYQEALDLCAYARQRSEQSRSPTWAKIAEQAVEVAMGILYRLTREEKGEA